jgi:hypothetical protein
MRRTQISRPAYPGLINRRHGNPACRVGGFEKSGGFEAGQMRKKNPKRSAAALSGKEFEEKYASLFEEDEDNDSLLDETNSSTSTSISNSLKVALKGIYRPPRYRPDRAIAELEGWWVVRALKAAQVEKCPEGFKDLVMYLLARIGVWPPMDVFRSTGKGGRPQKPLTAIVYRAWVDLGKTKLVAKDLDDLLKQFYGDEFRRTKTGSIKHKRLRDRLRGDLLRHKNRGATKPVS